MDDPTQAPDQSARQSGGQLQLGETDAQHQADVQSGRAFEWQAGQDVYERWLSEIAP